MALDPLATIEQFESGGQNIQQQITSPSVSTASGYYQITNSTWNSTIVPGTGLPSVGPGTPYPGGVMALSSAQQQQGAAFLYNLQGFGPWTCSGCNASLASYIQSVGGPSAFPALSSDAPSSGVPGVSTDTGVGTLTVSTAAGGVFSNTGSTATGFAPYSYIWQQYSSAVVGALTTEIGQVQHMVQGPVSAMLILSLIMLGFGVMRGLLALDLAWRWVVRIAVVLALVSPGSYYYETYVVGLFSGFPTWIAQQLSGYAGNNPAGIYDYLAAYIWNQAWHIWPSVPWSGAFLAALMLVVAVGVTWLGITLMFFVWLTAQALTGLVLVLGPVLILGLFFEFTRRIFNAFFEILIYLALVTLAADLMAGIFTQVISQAMNSVANSNSTGTAAIESLSGIALVTLILAMAVAVMPYLLDRIGVGAAAANGMGAGHRWLIRNFYTRVDAPARLVSGRGPRDGRL